jgi:hypothetical protein
MLQLPLKTTFEGSDNRHIFNINRSKTERADFEKKIGLLIHSREQTLLASKFEIR